MHAHKERDEIEISSADYGVVVLKRELRWGPYTRAEGLQIQIVCTDRELAGPQVDNESLLWFIVDDAALSKLFGESIATETRKAAKRNEGQLIDLVGVWISAHGLPTDGRGPQSLTATDII